MVRKDQPCAVFNGKPIRKPDFEFWIGLKAYVSQEILNWHSLRHSHSAEF